MVVSSRAAAGAESVGIVYVAVELSQHGWLVAVQTPGGNGRASKHRLRSGDADGLLDLIGRIQAREERATGGPVRAACCYEAGYDGFWLHRRLEAAGVASHVLDPASLQVDRRARRVKTDAIDAEALLRALMAHCRGEAGACRMVRVPSVEEEDAKRLHRERRRLIKERVAHVNRIKALLATQGISEYQPLKAERRARLDELRTTEGRPLAPRPRQELLRELDRLELVLEQVRAVEAGRDAPVRAERPADAGERMIADLVRLRGVGPETATVLVREAFYRGFAGRRQVAAYGGLTPSPYRSGGMQHDQGVSKAGNPQLRATMIELAWLWVRRQSGSALARWFVERVGAAGGRMRRIGIVAVARKLLIALWRYATTGLVPEGAGLKVA